MADLEAGRGGYLKSFVPIYSSPDVKARLRKTSIVKLVGNGISLVYGNALSKLFRNYVKIFNRLGIEKQKMV
ncbi:MAG: hypothetical protein SAQ54_04390 [Oscillatoria sp. PMC 1050.18]|nr:hypothetical protein [Oscillatoria sp. PMC 1050.18]